MPSSTFAAQATDPQATAASAVSAAPETVATPDQGVALIVGERAFATMDDVKTKIVNQDSHITDIEAENAQLRVQLEEANTKVATATSLDEVLTHKEENKDGGFSQSQLESLVSEQVGNLRADELINANRTGCIAQAEAAYGENMIAKMQAVATDLGLTMEDVDSMAGSNPKLFAKTFLPTAPTKDSTVYQTVRIN
jgi:hypothetical protein